MEIGLSVFGFIAVFVVLCCLCYKSYENYKTVTEEEKKKRWPRDAWLALELAALFLLFLFAAISFNKNYVAGFKYGGIEAMKARLQEPISSEVQLYGYEIIGTHIEKSTGSEKTAIEYSLDIRDLFYKGQIFKKVKVSEQFFKRISIGQCFHPTPPTPVAVPKL